MTPASPLIRAEELRPIYLQPDMVLLDCRYSLADESRGRKDFMQSHIPGAFYLDIGYDLSSQVIPGKTGRHPLPHPHVLTFTLRASGLSPDSNVIVYDQSNSAYAARAWWLLRWLGHQQVRVLDGGFNAWTNAGYPVDNAWPFPKQGTFIPHLHDGATISRHAVATTLSIVVDSREYRRYTGETEPIDPVAGHIAGAVCMPYLNNVDQNGYWKKPEELRDRFKALLESETSPIFYCGSGVTACHNILAYTLAGGENAILYPGSWSEWIQYYPPTLGPEKPAA